MYQYPDSGHVDRYEIMSDNRRSYQTQNVILSAPDSGQCARVASRWIRHALRVCLRDAIKLRHERRRDDSTHVDLRRDKTCA